jgi:hypothetical protein
MVAVMDALNPSFDRYHSAGFAWRPPIKQLERRIAWLRRSFGEGLGHRPNRIERDAMWRAARLRIIADYALSDPTCDANTQVRLANCADRAVAKMEALLERNAPPEYRPSLDEMLNAGAAE